MDSQAQAIVNTMEVLETKPITDLVSESVIKVCYVSDKPNPNRTVINYEVGKEIAASLPGAPVVGFFDKETGDFEQHSRRITISDGEVHIEDITKPYGFVSPIHQPWYQDFTEDGEIRTYLMCRAYLWTRQYEEAKLAFGKGQSMELDEHSMSGYYEGDVFVFTSATLDKLCILGDDYPPCFSGASIMSTYAKEYDSLAENIQNAIGRRYYIMNGQVKETPATPEKVTLEYALELGWNLNEAIYRQLDSRGFSGKYSVEGVYTEEGTIFTVLRDCETLEYLRCDVTITSDEKVEMATEFTAVSPTFVPKVATPDTGVPSLGNDPVPMPDDPATNNSASGTEPAVDPEPATPPEGAGNFATKKKEDEEGSGSGSGSNGDEGSSGGSTDDKKKQDEEDSNSGSGSGDGEGGSGSSDDEEKKKKKPATKNAKKKDDEDDDDSEDDDDDDEEYQKKRKNCAEGDGAEPDPEAPAIDFAARIAELEEELEKANTTIASITEELNAYKLKDEEMIKAQKEEMISSYSEMLSEDDVKDVREHINEYSLEDIESKLAVTYTRKVRESKKVENTASGIQVNVNSFSSQNDNLPDYLRDALEYDASRRLHLQ